MSILLQTFLTTKTSRQQKLFWFTLSLTFAAIYGLLTLQQAFKSEYLINDDARQHIFWMERFLDSQLFPQDLIADYFQSISPPGYAAFYQIFAAVGIHPLFLAKVIPVILGIVATAFFFGACLEMLAVPSAAFLGTLLLNQSLWMQEDLVSATSRAFLYPLFAAFIYYLLRRSLFPCLISIIVLGLVYPTFILICAGILILKLFDFSQGLPRLIKNRQDYIFCGAALGVCVAIILPLVLEKSTFGPFITVAEARQLPEFLPGGRVKFFDDHNPGRFWLSGSRSGWRLSFNPPIVILGLLLPLLGRFPQHFRLVKQLKDSIAVLWQLAAISVLLFFAAHALLFKLYLPSRYTVHSLRIVLALATGIALVIILDAIYQALRQHGFVAITIIGLILGLVVFYPNLFWKNHFPKQAYIEGEVPELYQFFQQQPKDTLIASFADEVNQLPSFAKRSILVGSEYALPYHVGYSRQFRQRTDDLISAQYSSDLIAVQKLVTTYGVDFFLLEAGTFTPEYIQNNRLLKQYANSKLSDDLLVKATTEAVKQLQQGSVPALAKVVASCTVAKIKDFTVLDAKCVTKS